MGVKSLEDLYVHGLKDILYAEKQIIKTLPKLTKAAQSPELKEALQSHLEQTKGQVTRLEQVFEEAGVAPRTKTCPAINGILEEGEETLGEIEDADVKDAAIIASCNKVEHYEIAAYGTLQSWAQQLGFEESARLLQETLDEEKEADAILTELAETTLNSEADDDEDSEDSEDEEDDDGEIEDEEEEEVEAKAPARGRGRK